MCEMPERKQENGRNFKGIEGQQHRLQMKTTTAVLLVAKKMSEQHHLQRK